MRSLTRLLVCTLLGLSYLVCPALGQSAKVDNNPDSTPITAKATGEQIRFAAPGEIVQLRLEVLSETGQAMFDVQTKGNVLDWVLADGAGARLQDGTYVCVVTVKSLSGRLSQRIGSLQISGQQINFKAGDPSQLSQSQQLAVGPLESQASMSVLQPGEAEAATTVAHDGNDGQLARTRGALSFRLGDFFSGQDQEQMRLTEEGNLGIGTATPKTKLDVAGTIRAREGLEFSDGSTLNVNKGALGLTNPDGTQAPNVSGSGTQNTLAKWTDNSGTLGDSLLGETGGGVELRSAAPGPGTNPTLTNAANVPGFSQLGVYPAAGQNANMSLMIVPRGLGANTNRAQFSVFNTDLIADATNYEFASLRARGPDYVFGTGKSGTGQNRPFMFAAGFLSDNTTNNGQLYLATNGNVGVGMTTPALRLDVAGDVNTTTQYDIGGNRVLGIPGTGNTFAGSGAGSLNTSGIHNSFFGQAAGAANTAAGYNSFFGYRAGAANTGSAASANSFFGHMAGEANTSGGSNSFFGTAAGQINQTGMNNSFFGEAAGYFNFDGNNNSLFGIEAGLNNNASGNSFFGFSAGRANTTGVNNAFFGGFSGQANLGSGNSFFGRSAGAENWHGFDNAFFGSSAGQSNLDACCNAFFGANSGFANRTGTNNSFFGSGAGSDNFSGANNSYFGTNAGTNSLANNNSFFGSLAGDDNTMGANNAFFGRNAGGANTSGSNNTFLGESAASANSNGSGNIVIGSVAGLNLVSGSNNIYLANSGANESNTIRIGTEGTQTATFIAGINGINVNPSTSVVVNANGQLGVIVSSRRYKKDIHDMGEASSKLMQLRPVTFLYRPEYVTGEQTLQYGLIAEEVAKVDPDLVSFGPDGKPQTVRYHLLNPMLLNELQKQQTHIKSQAQQLQSQAKQIADLEARLRRLETRPQIRRRGR